MATLPEIEQMWEKDCKIDETNLIKVSANSPIQHNKYYVLYLREQYLLEELADHIKKIEYWLDLLYQPNRLTEDEYKQLGWEPLDKCPPTAAERAKLVSFDPRMLEVKKNWLRQKNKCDYLKEIITQINARQWNVRNILEAKKFEAGVY